jgi:hypothetical protein
MKMKKLMTLFFVIICSTAYAQTAKNDTIIKIDGNQIVGKIFTISEKEIAFSYQNETIIYTMSKDRIKEVFFSSGRKEIFNDNVKNDNKELVIINDEDDWEKVVLTFLESDVEGLVKKGDINVSDRVKNVLFQSASRMEENVTEDAKTEAAKLGAHIIYVIAPITTDGMEFRITGVAYGYK